ncbi:MAG: peptide chain release factor N(5)-glutamine methyltransferase [Bacteroidales bacterium]|nr:peptide chain release factor N(5)-glutamine methyltransferase [Bacteroidales bacterium]
MTIRDVKIEYQQKLATLYEPKEIQSIFELVAETIGFSKNLLVLKSNEDLSEQQRLYFYSCLQRLEKAEPVQYVRGKADFYDLQFLVNPAVLIPRPETEELVHLVKNENLGCRGKIIDLGTGSGCIAVSLAKNIKSAKISALDISSAALEIAKQNAKNNEVEVEFILGDMQDSQCVPEDELFDVIVSNPPYVCNSEKNEMRPNVLQYEPHLALFVDEDTNPLQFYKAIVQFSQKHLSENGFVYCEINETLGMETQKLFVENGFANCQILKDLFGKDRFVKASRK